MTHAEDIAGLAKMAGITTAAEADAMIESASRDFWDAVNGGARKSIIADAKRAVITANEIRALFGTAA